MNKKELIITIIKTAMTTLPVVFALIMIFTPKEKWELFVGKLVSIRDLEIPTSNIIVIKTFAVLMLIAGLAMGFYFFIYDPSAAA